MNLIKFDKKCKCGPEFVCVRILDNCDELKIGNIYLPQMSAANQRLAHAVIEDVGIKAAEEYGVKTGDYVMIDRLSTFAHTFPIALLKYNNIIMKTDKDRTDYWPLRNMAFVELDQKDHVSDVGGIFVCNYADKLNIGTVTKTNFDPELVIDFKDGDKVLVTKGADEVEMGDRLIRIYKHDMLICKIED